MENNELKKACIKNFTCCYFNDIIKIEDFDFNILLDEKLYETFFIYVTYKPLIGSKNLWILFDRVDGFIRNHNGTKYFPLFGSEKYNDIFNMIRYLVTIKLSISDIVSHNYGKIKIDSCGDLPLEKNIDFANVVILIKSVFSKNYNQYFY